ncbi:PRC-barrel domain-containing protein [Polymorphobacter fuscus]|uniref:PRC-barrel domain-containing protein n=1 Tax=Sandarakinorhabdus fusca TaxID=1439888 RepID=A0A7C9KKJ4_9SPHN|nr:PRC-barrel domain-containing protein [Polymorphobacter fuscus]KAB7643619.1 PRC-barrel domain containing protein [Polymorphobacter fuscus]MQT18701.1 hypothetical protein [Polymorphobacter fuscus]NJC09587.1 hypothetical protein [Polymorphobacter fuscus]
MSTSYSDAALADGGSRDANTLISADKVHGTEVFNHAGDRLGTVDSIMIDKIHGDVAYVVMSFGGFLGIGEKYHPLPWDVLDYDTSLGGYRVDLDREALTDAPAYGRDDMDAFDYDRGGSDIDSYYADTPRASKSHGATSHTDKASGEPLPAGIDESNRSDANDGIERPLGFYSSQAQADRNADLPGKHQTNEVAKEPEVPGFFSPEQQKKRNLGEDGAARVVGPEGQQSAHEYEKGTGEPAEEYKDDLPQSR